MSDIKKREATGIKTSSLILGTHGVLSWFDQVGVIEDYG